MSSLCLLIHTYVLYFIMFRHDFCSKLYAWCFQNIHLFSKHGNNICLSMQQSVFSPTCQTKSAGGESKPDNNKNCAKADMNVHVLLSTSRHERLCGSCARNSLLSLFPSLNSSSFTFVTG